MLNESRKMKINFSIHKLYRINLHILGKVDSRLSLLDLLVDKGTNNLGTIASKELITWDRR